MADAPASSAPTSTPQAPAVNFDVAGARAAGYSDEEIAGVLAAKSNFDIEGARKAGYADHDIIGLLSPQSQDKGTSPTASDDTVKPDEPQPDSSTGGALARGAERGALPAAGGFMGAGAAMAAAEPAIGLAAAASGPLAPVTEAVGNIGAGLAGAFGGAKIVQEAQDFLLDHLPDSVTKAVGLDKGQEQADVEQHPYASMAGELAPNLALLRPGAIAKTADVGATALERALTNPITARAVPAAIMGGQEAVTEQSQEGQIDPAKVAIAAGIGAVSNKETALGQKLGRAAAAPVEAAINAVRPAPVEAAVPVLAADNVDDAIQAANDVVAKTPIDIEAMGQKAEADALAVTPPHKEFFGGLNDATIEHNDDGSYSLVNWDETGAAHPVAKLKVWDENAEPEAPEDGQGSTTTISPDLAAAQRDHYDKLGVKVVYFENDPTVPFDGAVDSERNANTLFLSNDPTRNAAQVGAHEFTHVLESTTLPDGTNLGDILHNQVREGLTPDGLAHAKATFGATAPDRAGFAEGPAGDVDHADAVTTHLIRELGADIGGEAPKFQTFMPKVVEAVQEQYGPQVAKGVLQKFVAGIKNALNTMRSFFGGDEAQANTVSQNWVSNLSEVHDTLAQMYAQRYGTQLEKEQAAVTAMTKARARAAEQAKPEKFDDVASFLARQGGIRNDEGHDLVKGAGLQQFVPGHGPLIRPSGLGIDEAGQRLWEAGYFGHTRLMPNGPSEAETLGLLTKTGRDIGGKPTKVYHPTDEAKIAAQHAGRHAEEQNAEREQSRQEIQAHAAKEYGERLSDQDADDVLDRMGKGLDTDSAVAEHIERQAIQGVYSDHEATADDAYGAATFRRGAGETDRGPGDGSEGQAAAGEDAGGAHEAREPVAENPEAQSELDEPLKFSPKDKFATEPGALDAQGRPVAQTIIPGAEKTEAQRVAAMADRARAELAARQQQSKLRRGNQEEPGGMFAEPDKQASLFSPKRVPAEEEIHDDISDVIEAVTGERPGQTVPERMLRQLAQRGVKQLKNVNPLEGGDYIGTLFPRTLASLDDLSARFWRSWMARDEDAHVQAEGLRKVISDSLVNLEAASRDHVYAAVELARKWNWRPDDNGASIRVKNTSYWQARKSKVGDDYVLSGAETKAFHDVMRLGDEGWKSFMTALARREGWQGEADPEAIRRAANEGGAGLPEGKRLLRLAAVLDGAKHAMERPYFPASRFGDYFIAVRPKTGTDEAATGGFPKVAWFETVEKPLLHDIMGKSRESAKDVQGVREALTRIRSMKDAQGNTAFPDDKFDIETGDLRARPDILRKLNIPAIEKLFMLMERGVTQSLKDKIVAAGSPDEGLGPKDIRTLKTQAQKDAEAHYQSLMGSAKDALMDAVYQDMLSGWKKQAQLTPGYSEDFNRAIGSHIHQVSKNAADIVHRNDIEDAYQNIQDNHPHFSVKDYWSHWRAYQENPRSPLSRAAANTAQIGAAYVMGLNPATTMVIASHTPLMATPVLGVGGGVGRATAEMLRAVREVYKQLSFDKEKGAFIDTSKIGRTPQEKALIAELERTGLNHSIGADDLRSLNDRQAGLWGKAAPTMRAGLDLALSNISAVDQANRNAIALAAHRMASNPATLEKMAAPWMEHNAIFREMVKNGELTPEAFAKFMLSEAAGAWGRTNQAPIMRGTEGSLIFALHGFQARFLSTAWKLTKNMGPAGRVAAAWMATALWAATGVNGLPFFQDAENAAGALWKKITGEDPMIDAHLREFLNDAGFGKIGTEVMMRGPLSVLLGVDLGSRLGFGDIISRTFDASDALGTYPALMLGRLGAAWNRARSGQGALASGAELLPSALRNPARAVIEGKEGVVSQTGTTEVAAGQIGMAHQLLRAAGLPPLPAAQAQARSEYLYELKNRDMEIHELTQRSVANLLMRATRASQSGDDQTAEQLSASAASRISDFNKKHWQTPITNQGLNQAIFEAYNPELARKAKMARGLRPEAENNPYP